MPVRGIDTHAPVSGAAVVPFATIDIGLHRGHERNKLDT